MKRTMQLVMPEDVPAIWAMAQEQNARHGTDVGVPRLFDDEDRQMRSIPLALKVMGPDGIEQAHIFELQPELLSFGMSPRATAFALEALPAAMLALESMGFHGFRALAPANRREEWERTWMQRLHLASDDARVAHFYRSFRGMGR